MPTKTTDQKPGKVALQKRSQTPTARSASAKTPAIDVLLAQQTLAEPAVVAPADLLALQRTAGNRATTRLIQTKLTVGSAGNHYEQEADRVAAQVMTMPAPAHTQPNLQRTPEEEEEVQAKAAGGHDHTADTAAGGRRRAFSQAARPACARGGRRSAVKPLAATITPLIQRQEDEEELQAKPLVQRAEEEDEELQAKPEIQRASAGAGFEVSGDFEQQLSASRGEGGPLPATVREFMEPRFGADFSDVRVHTGNQSAQLNRSVSAQAFTLGQDIYLGEGKDELESDQGKQSLAHELTHVVQQTGSTRRTAAHIQKTPAGVIQRHSSWEHKALGDITPDRLAVLGSYQEMTAAYKRAKDEAGLLGKVDPAKVKIPVDFGGQAGTLSMADFLHDISQEIDRLETFRDHPPTEASEQAQTQLRDLAEMREARKSLEGEFGQQQFRQKTKDKYQLAMQNKLQEIRGGERWQVRLLAIKHNDGKQTIITYGEMNTLGDFVGDPEQLQKMSQDNLQQVINGIRQQALIRFMRMRDTVKGNWNRNKNYWGQGFSNTAGATGRGLLADINIGSDRFGKLGSEGQGQLRLMLADKVKVEGKAETDYTSGLGRNACHFAPESGSRGRNIIVRRLRWHKVRFNSALARCKR